MERSTAKKMFFGGIVLSLFAVFLGQNSYDSDIQVFAMFLLVVSWVMMIWGAYVLLRTQDTRKLFTGFERSSILLDARNMVLSRSNMYRELSYSSMASVKNIESIDYWIGTAMQYAGYSVDNFKYRNPSTKPPFSTVVYERVIEGSEILDPDAKGFDVNRARLVVGVLVFFELVFLVGTEMASHIGHGEGVEAVLFIFIVIDVGVYYYLGRIGLGSSVAVLYIVEYTFPKREIDAEGGKIHHEDLVQTDTILYFTPEQVNIHLSVGIRAKKNVPASRTEQKFSEVVEALEHVMNILPRLKSESTMADDVFAKPLFEWKKNRIAGVHTRFPLTYRMRKHEGWE